MDATPLIPYLPPDTAPLIERWLAPYAFRLVITRPRKSKFGDFRVPGRGETPRISVNADLPPLQFALTLTHEIAHLMVWSQHGRVRPHGRQWQIQFGELLRELAGVESLPDDYREALRRHARKPRSSAVYDQVLYGVLRRLEGDGSIWLDTLDIGARFQFDGRRFEKLSSQRTRCVCLDLDSGLRYRVHKSVSVDPLP